MESTYNLWLIPIMIIKRLLPSQLDNDVYGVWETVIRIHPIIIVNVTHFRISMACELFINIACSVYTVFIHNCYYLYRFHDRQSRIKILMAPQNSTLLHESSELVKVFGHYSPIARNRCENLADDDDNTSSYSANTDVHDVVERKKSIAEHRRILDDEVCTQRQQK